MNVLVYDDEGVDPHSLQRLLEGLSQELTSPIVSVDHHFLIETNWEATTSQLIIPGGRDLPYHARLQGAGNRKILDFVNNGGRYVGICAGAYYGSAYIEFEKGGELEVTGERELAFYPGCASGPAYGLGLFSYESRAGARPASIQWKGGVSAVYFNGGCLFEEPERYPSVIVLARYDDLPNTPAAAVKCAVGKGEAILTGVHPEYVRNNFWKFIINH